MPRGQTPSCLVLVLASLLLTLPAPAREVLLKAVNTETKQPVPNFKAGAWFDDKPGGDFSFDEKGEHRLSIPDDARYVSLYVKHDGFVPTRYLFGREWDPTPIPDNYTLHVTPGVPVGGIVRDQDNTPVEGARVSLTFGYPSPNQPGGTLNANASATTGPDGRWSFNAAPRDATHQSLFVQHPDHTLNSSNAELRPAQGGHKGDANLYFMVCVTFNSL